MKMVIEIWSDVVCPFCYIGKRKIEKALSKFEHREEIKLVWRSYQLHPEIKTQPNKTIYEYMAERDELTLEQVKEQYNFIFDMAKKVELDYHLDKALLVNTRSAHQLLQFAKKSGKDSNAEELLFHAYFIENKNIDDYNVLESIAKQLDLDSNEYKALFSSNKYEEEIEQDIYQSKLIGVRGVPFFLMNNDVSISGAQDDQVFINSLEKAYGNWQFGLLKKSS